MSVTLEKLIVLVKKRVIKLILKVRIPIFKVFVLKTSIFEVVLPSNNIVSNPKWKLYSSLSNDVLSLLLKPG